MADGAKLALIVGVGDGLSACLARKFAAAGMGIGLAARNPEKLAALASETGARAYGCDATDAASVAGLFAEVIALQGAPVVVIYNPSTAVRGPIAEVDAGAVQAALAVTAFGGFLVGQQAARVMVPRGSGVVILPARRRASRAMRNQRRLRWASLRCAGWRRAWRGNCGRWVFMWRMW